MKLLVAVPSRNRFRENEILRNTWSWLQHSKFDKKVFVEPDEYDDYCKAIGKENVVMHKKNNIGIGGAKKSIQKYALKNGYDLVLKCDDDIWNWRDFKNGWYRYHGNASGVPMSDRKKANAEDVFDRAMEDSIELFENYDEVGAVMYLYGQMMFHQPGTKWTNFNSRLATVFMSRANLLAPPRSGEVHQFEEFYTWLELRKKGFVAPQYGLAGFHVDGDSHMNSGGLQDFNRTKMTNESIAIFNELYGDEVVYKKDNGRGGFHVTPDTRKIELCKPIKIPEDFKLN